VPSEPPPRPKFRLDARGLAEDTRVEVFTGGGPGGQHRNKTQNAVRLHHGPSQLIVVASERRSLEANRRAAFERLRDRLARLNHVARPRRPTRPSRGAKERRLEDKARAGRKKQTRQKPRDHD
jgi:protein subunit release factor A